MSLEQIVSYVIVAIVSGLGVAFWKSIRRRLTLGGRIDLSINLGELPSSPAQNNPKLEHRD